MINVGSYKRNLLLSLFSLFLLGTVLVSCHRMDQHTAQKMAAVQRVTWGNIIAEHTQGFVSRHSDIRVLFATDVVGEGKIDAHTVFDITPAVAGDVVFNGPRELVLHPAKELIPGTRYQVSVKPQGLHNVPQHIEPFSFEFTVQTPQLDVTVQNLEAEADNDQRMSLRGTVVTADTEVVTEVEQVVTAQYLGQTIALVWTHASDGLTHSYLVTGLQRQAQQQPVQLHWDGAPIGATQAGDLTVQVPARTVFTVTEAAANETENRQIVVYFSDNLDPQQTLQGLVRLTPESTFTTRIVNNTLTIYPQTELSGTVTVKLEAGIANSRGEKLTDTVVRTLTFSSEKPQVRFVGNGVILPAGKVLSVPFEAVNARSVHVTALRVYDDNMAQFLQVNQLSEGNELGRVGRYLWRKTIPLTGPITGRWTRYALDVSELMQQYPGGMFQLTLRLLPDDSAYECAKDSAVAQLADDTDVQSQESNEQRTSSWWDYAEEYYDTEENYEQRWNDRKDPCKRAYYTYAPNIRAQRNVLASNIGLLAKSDAQGQLLITTTDIRTAAAKSDVKLTVRNYQNQIIGEARSDATGLARITPQGTPFFLLAEADGQHAYLKLNTGNALPTSHFDVGGQVLTKGLKGVLYGDRGVWRPGDTLHLTFVVQDREHTLPANHPATLELRDPRGRLVQTIANNTPIDGFYRFDVKTADDAPTGNWNATVALGGASFNKMLKIEMVMPNRLKIALGFNSEHLTAAQAIAGEVSSEWLSGATAAGLTAEVKLRLQPTRTVFNHFKDYVFDDPARRFTSEPIDIFDDTLDAQGKASFVHDLALTTPPPGMLSATFTTRVFEPGGAFSISSETTSFAPYKRFVGVHLPAGDVARGMLQSDMDHVIEFGTLRADDTPVAVQELRVTLYKLEWRWWWDKNDDTALANYITRDSHAAIRDEVVSTDAQGHGKWTLRINYPEWGRYLVRVCDVEGGHCSGQAFYLDWPSWAGKQREQSGPAASMLGLTTDKAQYLVGETATVQLPESAQGRALVTVESGSGILDARWLEPKAGHTRFTVPITAAMAPNVYVAVTLVQPHEGKDNDRPIRLYGVVPLFVNDTATLLQPKLQAANEWLPESRNVVEVSEAQGRAMTYTLAVVDEGLLSLTNFKTPRLHDDFYQREALGVRTWDLFDQVIGSYGAQLERLLALGGSDAAANNDATQSRSRFPPVVQFIGPFALKAGAKAKHDIVLPRYMGAVRLMLVAGHQGAYGSAEQSIYVRQPLMILPTLPRVAGPGEEIAVPISVFVADPSIKTVQLSIQPDALFTVQGEHSVQVEFTQPAEKLGVLRLKAAEKIGHSVVKFSATSGKHRATGEINIEVRSANPPTTQLQSQVLQPGESWQATLSAPGMMGTNQASLEVSSIQPLNLEHRLGYLVQYPHGCLEQTTSSVFPQLFLANLMKLEQGRKQQIEDNIRAGIERLRWFQLANGGFSYWPGGSGGFATGSLEGYAVWATTYASHFLIEAEKAGYTVPASMRGGVIRHLRSNAQNWNANAASLDQAYRLYVLARAGQPEIGAMNRLREVQKLGATERWLLAASYHMAGLSDVSTALIPTEILVEHAAVPQDYTFGSTLRDRALVLRSMQQLSLVGKTKDIVQAISSELNSDHWYATQSTAYALMALAQLAGSGDPAQYSFEHTLYGKPQTQTATTPVTQLSLAAMTATNQLVSVRNTSQRVLYATVAVRGIPAVQQETADSAGLKLTVTYADDTGQTVDLNRLPQGKDIIVTTEVKNITSLTIDNIALTHIMPAGWEIQNERLLGAAMNVERSGAKRDPYDGSRAATRASVDYTDIRDDRLLQYFGLRAGESIRFTTRVTAAYRGRFYLPSVLVEAMYDASKQAHTKGQWTEVVVQ